ncbi:MAG: four helix bundle protein [Candidatus Sulfopaludibacter sp.]|nr:four helix bundle protein [Candidatus Sulfopaludibacter sp.]
MLDEGVHGTLLCGEIPGAYRRERPPIYGPFQTSADVSGSAGVAESSPVCPGSIRLHRGLPQAGDIRAVSQMRRASVSIPANIAEGFRRRSKAEKARFMNIAEGSVEECRYFLILAKDLGYGDTERLASLLEEVSRLLNAYTAAILTPDS